MPMPMPQGPVPGLMHPQAAPPSSWSSPPLSSSEPRIGRNGGGERVLGGKGARHDSIVWIANPIGCEGNPPLPVERSRVLAREFQEEALDVLWEARGALRAAFLSLVFLRSLLLQRQRTTSNLCKIRSRGQIVILRRTQTPPLAAPDCSGTESATRAGCGKSIVIDSLFGEYVCYSTCGIACGVSVLRCRQIETGECWGYGLLGLPAHDVKAKLLGRSGLKRSAVL